MTKKILILKGSPREKGNSATLAEWCADGAREAGASVESIYLHGLDIRSCDGCDLCTEGICIIEDDMKPIFPKLADADAIVLASPIYWFTFSAQLKLCIDRWYGFKANNWREVARKKYGIILTYGDTDLYSSGAINAIHTIESMCRYLKSEISGIVHASVDEVGDIQKHPDILQQAFDMGKKLVAEN